jgi:hypothetical protein
MHTSIALLRPITRRVRQRTLMIVKPNTIAHVDIAAAQRAAFEMFGLGHGRSSDLPADDASAWSWLVHWHDRGHAWAPSKSYT